MNHVPQTILTAIDTIAAGLAKQRKISKDKGEDGGCRYRGPDGCKCAVGWIMPDDVYDPCVEGSCAAALLPGRAWARKEWAQSLVGDGTMDKLGEALSYFQAFHDQTFGDEGEVYHSLLQIYANDSDEVLEAAIKRELIKCANDAYEVTHD